jgi:hypothetical protein
MSWRTLFRLLLLLLLLAAGCARAAPASPATSPPRPPASVASGSLPSAAPPAPGAIPAAAPPEDFGVPRLAPAPIAVTGYPHNVKNGMNDPAGWFGWTKDAELYGYCQQGSGRSEHDTQCGFLHRDGTLERRSSGSQGKGPDMADVRAIEAFLADNHFDRLRESGDAALPPALQGTWSFPDITLCVVRVAATITPDGGVVAPAFVKVGGSMDGEPPVYPVTLVPEPYRDDKGRVTHGSMVHFAVMNGMSLSPDGAEIGMVAHFFACEWCDDWAIRRMPVAALASVIYNDLGYRHHQRGEWERAAELFAKAAAADPNAKLPPYNLACALARRKDPGAEKALRVAILRGGDDVKARATKDPDFVEVREEVWFRALVRR